MITSSCLLALLWAASCRKGDGGAGEQSRADPEGQAAQGASLPLGWSVGPPSPVRKASFLVKGSEGRVADISLRVVPGKQGELLQHINAWRTQLGEDTLERRRFEETAEWISLPLGEGVVVDMEGLGKGGKPTYDGRLVTVLVERPRENWIFKMRGNAELVGAHKEAFLTWVKSVPPEAGKEADTFLIAEARSPAAGAPLAPKEGRRVPKWRVPDSWISSSPAPPCHAVYLVQEPGGRSGKVAVIFLQGDGGGSLAIVNAQRARLRLPALTGQDAAAGVQSVWSSHGEMSMIRLASSRGSMVSAWCTRPGEGTWLFELTGPAVVVKDQQTHFAGFLRSLTFEEK